MNDDEHSSVFQASRACQLDIVKTVDGRLLHYHGANRQAMLEELKESKPEFLIGILKSPATHVGTKVERFISDSLSQLCSLQQGWGGGNSPCWTQH